MTDQSLLTADEAAIQQQLAEGFFEQGVERFEQYDYERAVFQFTRAIYVQPQCARYFLARGNAHRMLAHDQEALEDYSSAIRFDPDLAEAYYWRGSLRRYRYEVEGAIEDFERYLSLCDDAEKRAQVMQSISDLKRSQTG